MARALVTPTNDRRWLVWDAKYRLISPSQITFLLTKDGLDLALVLRPCVGGLVTRAFKQQSQQMLFSQAFFEGKIVVLGSLVVVGRRFDVDDNPGMVWAAWLRSQQKNRSNWWCGVVSNLRTVLLPQLLRQRFGANLKQEPRWLQKLLDLADQLTLGGRHD